MNRRWWLVLLLGIAHVGSVHAQDGPFHASTEGEPFYAFVNVNALGVRSISADWLSTGEAVEADALVAELQSALAATYPSARSFGPEDVCGIVVGMGGTAKIDGGGGLGLLESPFAAEDALDATWLASVVGPTVPTIVIVDEFDLSRLGDALRDAATSEPYDLADVVSQGTVLQSGFALGLGSTHGATEVDVVHGHLVLHHVLSILLAKGYVVDSVAHGSAGEPSMTLMLTVGGEPAIVHLYGIVFATLHGLEEALDGIGELQSVSNGQTPLAVVISWGLTGCGLEAAYTDPDSDGFGFELNGTELQTYIEFLYAAIVRLGTATSVVEEVCRGLLEFAARTQAGEDSGVSCSTPDEYAMVATIVALAQFERFAERRFDEMRPETTPPNTVFFAAAGNEMFPFAMPPASFDSLVAVAACTPTSAMTPERAWFSNAGDVHPTYREAVAMGAWFEAPVIVGVMPDSGYWGTSFAAPLAALASWNRPQGSGGYIGGSELLWPHADDLCVQFPR